MTNEFSASEQYLFGDTHIFSPTVVNDLKLNYTRGNYSLTDPPAYFDRSLARELGLPAITAAGLPRFETGSGFVIGNNNQSGVGRTIDEGFNIANTLSYTRGNMTMKFGADLRQQRVTLARIAEAAGGNYVFNAAQTNSNGLTSGGQGGLAFASFLMGLPNAVTLRGAVIPYYYRWNSAAFFYQNDWKIKPNLTLNLGVRYGVQLPRTEKFDRQGALLLDEQETLTLTDAQRRSIATGLGFATTAPVPADVPTTTQVVPFGFSGRGGRSRYLTRIDKNDFEPRFGFSYAPQLFGLNGLDDRPLVIRGGYGISHVVLTGFDRNANPDFAVPTEAFNQDNPNAVVNQSAFLRLSSNVPNLIPSASGYIPFPEKGILSGADAIRFAGSAFAVAPDFEVPYVQSFNFSLSYEFLRNTSVEFAYVGLKGTNLFNNPLNINTRPFEAVEAIINRNLEPNTTVTNPITGTGTVQRGSLVSPFIGLDRLNVRFEPSVNSIRHAGYVSVQRRFAQSLAFTANYTFGKSIDEASDAGGDLGTGVFSGGSARGAQTSFGGTRRNERAVSSYDIKHAFAATANYELPFGRGRAFFRDAPGIVDALFGGYTINAIARVQSGYPIQVFLSDTNRLGVGTSGDARVRPNIVAGVPLRNPLYSDKCPFPPCEPILNPAAFIRPPKGELGNAPRTFDSVRTPMRENLDISLHKNFYFSENRSRSVQLRLTAINVFNHPNFNYQGGSGNIFNAPTEDPITLADYNSWATANGRPAATAANTATEGNRLFSQVQSLVTTNRVPGSTNRLPDAFFSVPVAEGFHSRTINSFDITALEGFKLYRLRQNYNNNFITLQNSNADGPRYLEFAIKFYF